MGPLMIIRTNLQSEDIRIEATDPLEARLERLFSELRDPSSPHFIQSDYLFYRCRRTIFRIFPCSTPDVLSSLTLFLQAI